MEKSWSRAWSAFIICITIQTTTTLGAKKGKEIEIVTQYKPDDCSVFAEPGDDVKVHYTGKLQTGAIFDSSVQRREPFTFTLGQGKVIAGWEIGIKGMCVGERRKLVIPPNLAYGKNGHPPVIPPDSTLIFETELLEVNKAAFEINIQRFIQFISVPCVVLYVIYYMYKRYREETARKGPREDRRQKKKKY